MQPIAGFENYLVTEDGRIYASHLGKYLSPYSNGLGYLAVKLTKSGKRFQKYVHRLVAEAYLKSPVGLDVNHKDGVKTNNRVDNLEVVTHKENMQHALQHDLLRGYVMPGGSRR